MKNKNLYMAFSVLIALILVMSLMSVLATTSFEANFHTHQRAIQAKNESEQMMIQLLRLKGDLHDLSEADEETFAVSLAQVGTYSPLIDGHLQTLKQLNQENEAEIDRISVFLAAFNHTYQNMVEYEKNGKNNAARAIAQTTAAQIVKGAVDKTQLFLDKALKQQMRQDETLESALVNNGSQTVVMTVACVVLALLMAGIAIRTGAKNEKILHQEKDRFGVTLHAIGDGVIVTDTKGNINIFNAKAEMLTGWKKDEAVGKPFTTVFNVRHEDKTKLVENPIQKVLETGTEFWLSEQAVLDSKDGSHRHVADSAAPIFNEKGELQGAIMVFRDITEQKMAAEKIRRLSMFDSLTGLYNRAQFEQEMKGLENLKNLPMAMIMGDVNGLKLTNDVFGHANGDVLLKETANIMKKCAGQKDVLCRWGGDEFVICIPNADLARARKRCRNMAEMASKKRIPWSDGVLSLSISFGTAVKTKKEESLLQVLQEAENMMYHQKLVQSKNTHSAIVAFVEKKLYEKDATMRQRAEKKVNYCWELGRRCGCAPDTLRALKLLARYHDIGKIAIDDAILNKIEPLTEEEWEIVKRHPEIGYRLALATPETTPIASNILSHHENWDGTGYPQGLKERDIPLPARIVAIVDAYDAMTRTRPLHKAMSKQEAIEDLKNKSGTQFDPRLVELMIETLEREEREPLPFYI